MSKLLLQLLKSVVKSTFRSTHKFYIFPFMIFVSEWLTSLVTRFPIMCAYGVHKIHGTPTKSSSFIVSSPNFKSLESLQKHRGKLNRYFYVFQNLKKTVKVFKKLGVVQNVCCHFWSHKNRSVYTEEN